MAGPLGQGRPFQGEPAAAPRKEVLLPRHVPLPVGRRPARRPPGGLHGDRHPLPRQEDAGLRRPAPHGLGRLRPSGREFRPPDRHAPPRGHPKEHRQLQAPDSVPGILLRLGPRNRHDRPRLLQVDPVDLPATLQEGPRLRGHGPDQLVSLLQDGPGQRGGLRRRLRALRGRGRAQKPQAVGPQDHGLRREARSGPRGPRLAPLDFGDAEELDRPLRGGRASLQARRRRGPRGLHHPPRHDLRRDLHGPGPRASAGRRAHHSRPKSRGRGLRPGRAEQVRPGALRAPEGKDRGLHRRRRRQSGQRKENPDLDRGLCPGRLRHGRHHGGPRPRRPGLGLRPQARA